jgi:hypothetical protein
MEATRSIGWVLYTAPNPLAKRKPKYILSTTQNTKIIFSKAAN